MTPDTKSPLQELPAGLVIFGSDGRAQFGWQNPETGAFYAEADGSIIARGCLARGTHPLTRRTTMEDFAYLARESNAAWLAGRGDGRFERYEKFYQSERAVDAAGFDLEKANEGYGEYVGSQPSPLLSFLSAPWVGRVVIALFALYMGTRLVPQLAKVGPYVTGITLLAAFIGLRVFHRRNRKRR